MSGREVSIILIGQEIALGSWSRVMADVDLGWHKVSKKIFRKKKLGQFSRTNLIGKSCVVGLQRAHPRHLIC